MKIEFSPEPISSLSATAVVASSFEGEPASSGTVEALPASVRALVGGLEAAEFSAKPLECALLQQPAGLAAKKLLVVGAGKREKFDSNALRRAAGTAVRTLRAHGVHDLAWLAGAGDDIEAIAEGAVLADYDADRYRTERNHEKRIDRVTIATNGAEITAEARAAAERGRILGESANFTRDLVNEPSNSMTPTLLAERARQMAAEFGLAFQALGPEEIQALKMGAFWSVAQGSEEPPRLIVVRYNPPAAVAVPEAPVVGLVGKGITFDTGGISIKPSADMHEMKTDMAGGATMLGVMRALAQLQPPVRVFAVVPASENMPSGKASKPGDVVTSMSGKTIEILNTDAEGRLLLADAITYAKQQGATVVIDAATLTSAVTIALGNITTGVFGWDKDWVNRVLAAAHRAGERMWQLPVDDDYRDLYKSAIADLANTGGRYGGAITAAMFVGEFAGSTPWVHLDIAGTRWSNDERPYLTKGPTGHGVRTLVELLTTMAPSLR